MSASLVITDTSAAGATDHSRRAEHTKEVAATAAKLQRLRNKVGNVVFKDAFLSLLDEAEEREAAIQRELEFIAKLASIAAEVCAVMNVNDLRAHGRKAAVVHARGLVVLAMEESRGVGTQYELIARAFNRDPKAIRFLRGAVREWLKYDYKFRLRWNTFKHVQAVRITPAIEQRVSTAA